MIFLCIRVGEIMRIMRISCVVYCLGSGWMPMFWSEPVLMDRIIGF